MIHPADFQEIPHDLSPAEKFEIARAGGEAETVQRVLGQTLAAQKDFIFNQFAQVHPDLGVYAHWAGQARLLLVLQKTLDLQIAQGNEAADEIRKM